MFVAKLCIFNVASSPRVARRDSALKPLRELFQLPAMLPAQRHPDTRGVSEIEDLDDIIVQLQDANVPRRAWPRNVNNRYYAVLNSASRARAREKKMELAAAAAAAAAAEEEAEAAEA